MATVATPLTAYESLARAYDAFTFDHDHERWLALLEELALEHGLRGRDVLDVACGTGKSFLPLLARGYRVAACDASPAMAAHAAAKAPAVEVRVADMRDPALVAGRRFDLVTCLADALNHLPDEAALRSACRVAAEALRPGGIYLFDLNTLRMFRELWGPTWCRRSGRFMFVWEPLPSDPDVPGRRVHGRLHLFEDGGAGAWTREELALSERHFPEPVVRAALAAAGLECLAVRGLQTDGSMYPAAEERRDTKAIYVARKEVS